MSYVQLTSEERYVIYHLKLYKLSLRGRSQRSRGRGEGIGCYFICLSKEQLLCSTYSMHHCHWCMECTLQNFTIDRKMVLHRADKGLYGENEMHRSLIVLTISGPPFQCVGGSLAFRQDGLPGWVMRFAKPERITIRHAASGCIRSTSVPRKCFQTRERDLRHWGAGDRLSVAV